MDNIMISQHQAETQHTIIEAYHLRELLYRCTTNWHIAYKQIGSSPMHFFVTIQQLIDMHHTIL